MNESICCLFLKHFKWNLLYRFQYFSSSSDLKLVTLCIESCFNGVREILEKTNLPESCEKSIDHRRLPMNRLTNTVPFWHGCCEYKTQQIGNISNRKLSAVKLHSTVCLMFLYSFRQPYFKKVFLEKTSIPKEIQF